MRLHRAISLMKSSRADANVNPVGDAVAIAFPYIIQIMCKKVAEKD